MTTRTLPRLCRPASALVLCVVVLAACSERRTTGDGQAGSTALPSTTPGVGSATSTTGDASSARITITVGDRTVEGTLDDNAASRDLIAQLPVTLELSDHGSVEKTGPLPRRLSTAGTPDGADPDVGDMGYYAPSNDFVLYYGDQGHFPGIIVLGRMDPSGPDLIGGMNGDISVTVTRAG